MKAILVIDVPALDDDKHLCNECPIWNRERLGCEYDRNTGYKGCPLKPMPEKDTYEPSDDHEYSKAEIMAYTYGLTVGRNLCIEEIENG